MSNLLEKTKLKYELKKWKQIIDKNWKEKIHTIKSNKLIKIELWEKLSTNEIKERKERLKKLNLNAIEPKDVSKVYEQIKKSKKTKWHFGLHYEKTKFDTKIIEDYQKYDLHPVRYINNSITIIKNKLKSLKGINKLNINYFTEDKYDEIIKKLENYISDFKKLDKDIYKQRKDWKHKIDTDILFTNKEKLIKIINEVRTISRKAGIDTFSSIKKEKEINSKTWKIETKESEGNQSRLAYDDLGRYLKVIKIYKNWRDIVNQYSHIWEHMKNLINILMSLK